MAPRDGATIARPASGRLGGLVQRRGVEQAGARAVDGPAPNWQGHNSGHKGAIVVNSRGLSR